MRWRGGGGVRREREVREDLLLEVSRLAREGRFDYLVIESTGISEPLPVAETFTFAGEDGASLSATARLDTMVTVVDAWNFYRDYFSRDTIAQRGESLGEDDHRSVVDLLIDQIEFADVIVLNKCDLVNEHQRAALYSILRALNPRAGVVEATEGRVPLDRLLDTGLFSFEEAARAPGWMQEMRRRCFARRSAGRVWLRSSTRCAVGPMCTRDRKLSSPAAVRSASILHWPKGWMCQS